MRICHVITKPELGGAQLSTLNLLSGLKRDGFDVSVVTSPKGMLRPEYKGLKGVKCFFSPFLVRPINPLSDIFAFIHICLIYRRNKYDIVHTHSSKAGIIGRWAALFAGTPFIIHTVHGWSFNDHQNPVKKRFFILLEKMTAGFTTRIICVSNRDIQTGLRHGIAPADKFAFIKYGIPIGRFRRPPADLEQKKRRLGITNSGPVVGMISCLKPQKSPMDYIKASIKIYEKMPDVNFLLVGDGALKARCKRLLSMASLNGRFIFAGWRKDIPDILDILDVVVLTSKWEGMPISVIEALCKGCPVVAADAGGTAELVKDGVNGYITKPGSYKETAERVLTILRDRGCLDRMKKEAASSIDDSFGADRMVTEVGSLYKRLKDMKWSKVEIKAAF